MDIYCTLWVRIHYYLIYFVSQIIPVLNIGSYFSWLLSLTYIHQCGIFEHFLTFWPNKMPQGNLVHSLPNSRIRQSSISLTSLGFSYWRMILEVKVWVLSVLIATGAPLLSSTSQVTKQENVCVCVLACICAYTHVCLNVLLSLLICSLPPQQKEIRIHHLPSIIYLIIQGSND